MVKGLYLAHPLGQFENMLVSLGLRKFFFLLVRLSVVSLSVLLTLPPDAALLLLSQILELRNPGATNIWKQYMCPPKKSTPPTPCNEQETSSDCLGVD